MPNANVTRVLDAVDQLVARTNAAQLDDPTPCTEWKVRDLLNHLVGGGHMFAAGFRGVAVEPPSGPVDLLGDDHVAAWKAARADFEDAVDAPGAMDSMIELPFATMPGPAVVDLATFDVAVHCWDLARATGQRAALSDELVADIDEIAHRMLSDDLRVPGVYGAEVEPPATAGPLDRLAAFTGRRP